MRLHVGKIEIRIYGDIGDSEAYQRFLKHVSDYGCIYRHIICICGAVFSYSLQKSPITANITIPIFPTQLHGGSSAHNTWECFDFEIELGIEGPEGEAFGSVVSWEGAAT